jgi:hypothetical protein
MALWCLIFFFSPQLQDGFCNVRVNASNISNDDLDHCHLSAAPLQGSSTAWQQLLAATLLCLLFMVCDK